MRERPEPPWITGLGQSRELPQTGDLAQYLIVAVILLLLALAGWLYLSTTVRVDTLAVEIHQLELQKEERRREIVRMNAELATKESLERVRQEAQRMGYTPRRADQRFPVPVSAGDESMLESGAPGGGAPGLWQRLSSFFSGRAAEESP
jgi:LPXTG-motif cell wall-anchored protein